MFEIYIKIIPLLVWGRLGLLVFHKYFLAMYMLYMSTGVRMLICYIAGSGGFDNSTSSNIKLPSEKKYIFQKTAGPSALDNLPAILGDRDYRRYP